MGLVAAGLLLFYYVPAGNPYLAAGAMGLIGFAVYAPQFLVGVFAADLATRKAAATAIGVTGVFGYAGSFVADVGTGRLVDRFGWRGGFASFIAAALLGALFTLPLFGLHPRADLRK
jgi:sugar phosphate permease